MNKDSWKAEQFFFWAIFLFAATVRLKGLSSGLPLHTLYGETDTLQILIRILQTGDLNPQQFVYPGLAYYIFIPFFYLFYLIGIVSGHFTDLKSVPDSSFIFVGRFVCAQFGIASVYMTYKIGKEFSKWIGLFAMGILAAVPQHVEYSHMLRPEIPAIFFVLLAQKSAFSILNAPSRRSYWYFGVFAGCAFSTKYNIGLPLLLTLGVAHLAHRGKIYWSWLCQSLFAFLIVFSVSNPFLIANPNQILNWIQGVDAFYSPGENYYGKNNLYYYIEFLTRYDYNLPLIVFSVIGLILTFIRKPLSGLTFAVYPLIILLWNSSLEVRRTHSLLPLHPFIAIWAAYTLEEIWKLTREFSRATIFKLTYVLLIVLVLFWPYYRVAVQTYLMSGLDNRSKAELWMTNHIEKGSKIALLQFHQVEPDPRYFQIQSFLPKEYLGIKDFHWFRENNFDYVIASSGQYMRYFTEGKKAQKYKDYFLKFFQDGSDSGILVLDLTTHPSLIPDYRIKVFATKKLQTLPDFTPAIEERAKPETYRLAKPNTLLPLPPGYYSLELPAKTPASYSITVKNLKLNEIILQRHAYQSLSAADNLDRFPFAIFPIKLTPGFSLFSKSGGDVNSNQFVQFGLEGEVSEIRLKRIRPAIHVSRIKLSPVQRYDVRKPYLLFEKKVKLTIEAILVNRSRWNIDGYVEGFLSEIGESQPWKTFEAASGIQEFFLEPDQAINIEIPMTSDDLTGDHELSCWIFTRQDLPYSPQNGYWLNKQVRINDPRLGIHPIYNIPIP